MHTMPKQRSFSFANARHFLHRKLLPGAVLCLAIPTWAHAQGVPVKLNGPLVEGGDVGQSLVSSDSATVVYVADQDEDNVREIYSVPIDGGMPTQLRGRLDGCQRGAK
ncbi:MAG: hypothetical protein AB8B96_05120 [Lysobacterales bacterium]